MTKKQKLVYNLLNQITVITQAVNDIEDSIEVFLDRGYQVGGDDPIIQDDINQFEITLFQLYQIKTFYDNFSLFLNNGIPAQSDYMQLLNKLRKDK